jgi:FixJ family two-component response regulator
MNEAALWIPLNAGSASPDCMGETKADFQVIVVDDEREILETEVELLDGRDFTVLGFTSASAALNHIKDNADKILYVVSDLRMPEFDGMSFRTKILGVASA